MPERRWWDVSLFLFTFRTAWHTDRKLDCVSHAHDRRCSSSSSSKETWSIYLIQLKEEAGWLYAVQQGSMSGESQDKVFIGEPGGLDTSRRMNLWLILSALCQHPHTGQGKALHPHESAALESLSQLLSRTHTHSRLHLFPHTHHRSKSHGPTDH